MWKIRVFKRSEAKVACGLVPFRHSDDILSRAGYLDFVEVKFFLSTLDCISILLLFHSRFIYCNRASKIISVP